MRSTVRGANINHNDQSAYLTWRGCGWILRRQCASLSWYQSTDLDTIVTLLHLTIERLVPSDDVNLRTRCCDQIKYVVSRPSSLLTNRASRTLPCGVQNRVNALQTFTPAQLIQNHTPKRDNNVLALAMDRNSR